MWLGRAGVAAGSRPVAHEYPQVFPPAIARMVQALVKMPVSLGVTGLLEFRKPMAERFDKTI